MLIRISASAVTPYIGLLVDLGQPGSKGEADIIGGADSLHSLGFSCQLNQV